MKIRFVQRFWLFLIFFKSFVLSCNDDDFFTKNMFLNFGDLADNIKKELDLANEKRKVNMKIESLGTYLSFKSVSSY